MLFLFSFWHPYNSDVGMVKVVPDIPQPLLISFNCCFFILFWLNVYFFLLLQIVHLGPSFLPFTVGSLCIFFYFIFYCLHFSSILQPYSIISVSLLITSVLNYVSDRLAIFLLLGCIFSGALIYSFIWAISFFCVGGPVM